MVAQLTAVVLSPEPVELALPGVTVLNHVSKFDDHWGMNKARRMALRSVQTDYWFFMDSDDCLPADYLSVLAECVAQDTAVAYTDELVCPEGKEAFVRRPGEYTQAKHAASITLLHHLVLCRTADTEKVVKELPIDTLALFEFMLYFRLAARSAGYVPRVGYQWNRGKGFHTKPDALQAVVLAAAWCNRNK
jgi:hypothetical protein